MSIQPTSKAQLTPCLFFRPGATNLLGTRIRIDTQMPPHYGQPPVMLEATLTDVTSEEKRNRFPVYRFVLDEPYYNCPPAQQLLQEFRSYRKELLRGYSGSEEYEWAASRIRSEITPTPPIWLVFAASDWIVAEGDKATLTTQYLHSEPLGTIESLVVL